ncbi:MAG: hypothetical protein CVU11_16135, partial [Bacteroidetes bacterium HGW-Bacteroidetes-6]
TTASIAVSPLVSTEYIVTVTGVNSCTDVDTVLVTVKYPPVAPNTPSGIAVRCQGADTGSYSTNWIPEADIYSWVITPAGSGTITGTNENSSVIWNYNFTGTSEIIAIATNTCGSDSSAVLTVQTNPMPFPDLGNDTTICSGGSVILDAGTADTYSWNDGFDQQLHEIFAQGQFYVETTLGACSNSDTVNVYISDPVMDFGVDTIFSATTVTLDAGPGFTGYLWNDSSTGQTLQVSIPGWYSVTVTNEYGCTATDSVYVDINTGTDEQMRPGYVIYPNPVGETLFLKISSAKQEAFKIELISAEGQILDSRHIECNSVVTAIFDFSKIQPGVYFLQIKTSNGFEIFKIIK